MLFHLLNEQQTICNGKLGRLKSVGRLVLHQSLCKATSKDSSVLRKKVLYYEMEKCLKREFQVCLILVLFPCHGVLLKQKALEMWCFNTTT